MRFDESLEFLRDPYHFIANRCRQSASDVYKTRLFLRKTLCITGRHAAELFYDEEKFVRHGATPEPIQKTLLGTSGVQTLDGEAHRHRKAMFLAFMTPSQVEALAKIFQEELHKAALAWQERRQVVLYDALLPVLTRSVCRWAAVPLAETEVELRTNQLTAMFDAAGRPLWPHVRSRLARKRAQRWAEKIIQAAREQPSALPLQTVLRGIALHRDLDRELLPVRTAAVELLNILRPTLAIAVYIVFCAHALHQSAEATAALRTASQVYMDAFVHEVRRFYPFFPAVPARVRRTFHWQGHKFPRNRRVLLDLHGINHDARLWQEPALFLPQRFLRWNGDAYRFVPQGGGDHWKQHRCPGEWITLALMRAATEFFVRQLQYTVPSQDLSVDATRLPALPRSGFVISEVKIRTAAPHRSITR